ncbi:hypothetical protein HPB52_003863 [Rhipicephalus sanguineus]|uniref:Uncharacterized protein n=1 Tax=Rhipicephalus sanguineus TaxID=34632 RepID=A0A9D4QBZ6_RHISA|nr:hypothetical protein HPB52_003863 [Rhipicephalus sanguineus]
MVKGNARCPFGAARNQSYDDLCAAVLARYGETCRPLPRTREFRISPPSTRAVPIGLRPSFDNDRTPPATPLSTSRPATSAVVPAPDDVAAAIDQSTTRCGSSTPSADGPQGMPAIRPSSLPSPAPNTSLTSASTPATLQYELVSDTDMISSTVRSSVAEVSPSTISERDLSSTSKLCASCQQRPASPSTSTATEVRAPCELQPHLRDAATMTEVPEDDMPAGSPMAAQAANVTPATSAGIQHPDLRTSPRVPPAEGVLTRTGASSEPAEATPVRSHRRFASEPLTQDAAHPTWGNCAGALCRPPPQVYCHRTRRYFVSRYRRRARCAPCSHRHCRCLCNASTHAQPTFWDRLRHAQSRAHLLLPTASIRRDPRPLRSS